MRTTFSFDIGDLTRQKSFSSLPKYSPYNELSRFHSNIYNCVLAMYIDNHEHSWTLFLKLSQKQIQNPAIFELYPIKFPVLASTPIITRKNQCRVTRTTNNFDVGNVVTNINIQREQNWTQHTHSEALHRLQLYRLSYQFLFFDQI